MSETTLDEVDITVVTVSVGENATVFEGPDTVYRYDLPGSGVAEGWALNAVVDQIKQLTAVYWPEIEVVVDADEQATEMLTRTLLNKGVAAYPTEVLREVPLPEPAGELEITRPTRGSTHRSLGLHPLHLAIAVVIIAVAGASWWAIDSSTQARGETAAPPASSAIATSSPGSSTSNTPAPVVEPVVEPPVPGEVILEHSGLRVAVPRGFRAESTAEDLLMAVGDDPGLRIHLAADPVHSVPAAAIYQEVAAMITADPALSEVAAPAGDQPLIYREDPGDDSQVTWTTWVADEHQFSVGCHTRQEPTTPQRAACRMAVDSLSLQY